MSRAMQQVAKSIVKRAIQLVKDNQLHTYPPAFMLIMAYAEGDEDALGDPHKDLYYTLKWMKDQIVLPVEV